MKYSPGFIRSIWVFCAISMAIFSTDALADLTQRQASVLATQVSMGDSEALKKLTAEANKGNAYAQFELGTLYGDGTGVPKDYSKGEEWLLKAANQGFAGAQITLSVIYGKGLGVPQNMVVGTALLDQPAARAYINSQFGRKDSFLKSRPSDLTAGQYEEAKALSQKMKIPGNLSKAFQDYMASHKDEVKVISRFDKAKVQTATFQIADLDKAVAIFRLDVGRYPTNAEGLQALVTKPDSANGWNGPYLRGSLPSDPWNHPYHYANLGPSGGVQIMSYGADNAPGGEGENADIVNQQLPRTRP